MDERNTLGIDSESESALKIVVAVSGRLCWCEKNAKKIRNRVQISCVKIFVEAFRRNGTVHSGSVRKSVDRSRVECGGSPILVGISEGEAGEQALVKILYAHTPEKSEKLCDTERVGRSSVRLVDEDSTWNRNRSDRRNFQPWIRGNYPRPATHCTRP